MRKLVGSFWRSLCAAVVSMQLLCSTARAVSTMADWVGVNNSPATTTFVAVKGSNGAPPTDENFVVISPTSIGGTVQAKINYSGEDWSAFAAGVNAPHLYLADQSLEGTIDFTTPLHMSGTMTFDTPSDVGVEPNFCFCWYNSEDTRHRIGLGLSNWVESGHVPSPDSLRVDFGYAAAPANKFYFVSNDGTQNQFASNSVLPDGTYQFEFDYVPGNPGDPPLTSGSVSARVHNESFDYHYTVAPLANDPYNLDFFSLDRFGIVIRSTGSVTNQGKYNLTLSNVTYTGGTAVAGVPGDYNGNGVVDTADYILWRDGGTLQNEVDTPGTVNAADYTEWRARFGNTSGSGSGLAAGAVPEPTVVALAMLAGLATVASWRRRS